MPMSWAGAATKAPFGAPEEEARSESVCRGGQGTRGWEIGWEEIGQDGNC